MSVSNCIFLNAFKLFKNLKSVKKIMKYTSCLVIFMMSFMPFIASAQNDTTSAIKTDTTSKPVTDTVVATPAKTDTAIIASTPMNCYKEWISYFTDLGAKTVTDGTQLIVIAFKSKDNCRCFMGKVDVAGGKIKMPVYIQSEGGDYKSFTAIGKKLDPEFITAQGDGLWDIANGMSVVFQTTEQEYGRIFFYKFLNKNKQMNKEAPSPSDLLKNN
jgi:hypothetical protein